MYRSRGGVSLCMFIKYSLSHQISSYTVAIETGFSCSPTVFESKGKGKALISCCGPGDGRLFEEMRVIRKHGIRCDTITFAHNKKR